MKTRAAIFGFYFKRDIQTLIVLKYIDSRKLIYEVKICYTRIIIDPLFSE